MQFFAELYGEQHQATSARALGSHSWVKFQVKRRPKEVVAPEHLLRQLRAYEDLLSTKSGSLPYRHQIQLNSVTESLAVIRGDVRLKQDHIDTVSLLSK